MGFLDKMKEAADKATQMASNAADKATQMANNATDKLIAGNAEKRAEQAAYNAEMNEKMRILSEERKKKILDGFSGDLFFEGIDDNTLLAFTKDFFDKIVLPATSLLATSLEMYPHIEAKSVKKIKKTFPDYDDNEKVLLYLRVKSKSELLFMKDKIVFSDSYEEDEKYHITGEIPFEKISNVSVSYKDEKCIFMVNDIAVFSIDKTPVYERDFISIQYYLKMIKDRDFEITDEETDAIIREKIGESVYEDARRKMTYDDEILLYFCWGVDSVAAKDYLCCTDKQIIYLDREALGATVDIKQFYYEDITSMATLQNSNSSSLTGYLLDTALTSSWGLCDLEITVAGSKLKISTLKKLEADRVVEIYHQKRKEIKEEQRQSKVVVQQANEPDVFEQLEKLSKLKSAGILTEDEFNQKKADLLSKL